MEYKDTIFLPKTSFEMRANLPSKEPAIIEEWDKENIFKPFYQSNNQWETTQEGMGLGLSICQKLINCLNGNIYIAECDNQYLFDYISNHNNEIKNNYKFINCIEFWLPINNNTLLKKTIPTCFQNIKKIRIYKNKSSNIWKGKHIKFV